LLAARILLCLDVPGGSCREGGIRLVHIGSSSDVFNSDEEAHSTKRSARQMDAYLGVVFGDRALG